MRSLESQLSDYGARQKELYAPISLEELALDDSVPPLMKPSSRSDRPMGAVRRHPAWLLGLGATVAILTAATVVGLLAESSGSKGATADNPTAPEEGDPFTPGGAFQPGRHSFSVDGVFFSASLPGSGWYPFGSVPDTWLISRHVPMLGQEAGAIVFWAGYPWGMHAVPCPEIGFNEDPATASSMVTIDSLAALLAGVPGAELTSGPSVVSVGGRPARHLAFVIGERGGCDPGFFYNWKLHTQGTAWRGAVTGDTVEVWLVDVTDISREVPCTEDCDWPDGADRGIEIPVPVLLIAAESHPEAGSAVSEEIEEIIQSIRFD